MSQPRTLQNQFLGFQRDKSRDQLPQGYCYDVLNMLPNLGVPLRGRGGWRYSGSALDSLNAGAGYPGRIAYAPFQSTAPQVVAIDDTLHRIFDLTNGVDRGGSGLGDDPIHTPVFYNDLLIMTDGINAPKKYDGASAGSSLTGSPPSTPRCVAVYKDRLLLSGAASSASEMRKIYFSAAGNPDSWDTTNRWIGTSSPVQGLAPLRNALIVFHAGTVERIRGDIPPGSSAANMVLEPLFGGVGIFEPNAFVVADDTVIWADQDGVYQSDGASISDLTKQGGIKTYWRNQITSPVTNMAVGFWKGWVYISLMGAGHAFQDFLMCDLQTRGWYRLDNIRARNFSAAVGTTDEFYFANQATKRVGELSTIFTPGASYQTDGDGTSFSKLVDTPYFSGGQFGTKRFRWVYVSYDIRNATGTPTLPITYTTTPEGLSNELAAGTLAETSQFTRQRVPIARGVSGISVRVATTDNVDDFKLYSLDADILPREGSRRG